MKLLLNNTLPNLGHQNLLQLLSGAVNIDLQLLEEVYGLAEVSSSRKHKFHFNSGHVTSVNKIILKKDSKIDKGKNLITSTWRQIRRVLNLNIEF